MLTYKGHCAYAPDTDSMDFQLHGGKGVVNCSISRESLEDHFGSDEEPETIFAENVLEIVDAAVEKYASGKIDADGWVRLGSADKI